MQPIIFLLIGLAWVQSVLGFTYPTGTMFESFPPDTPFPSFPKGYNGAQFTTTQKPEVLDKVYQYSNQSSVSKPSEKDIAKIRSAMLSNAKVKLNLLRLLKQLGKKMCGLELNISFLNALCF